MVFVVGQVADSSLNLGRLDADNPSQDDFELWSPSEEREEQCLFGRQVRTA